MTGEARSTTSRASRKFVVRFYGTLGIAVPVLTISYMVYGDSSWTEPGSSHAEVALAFAQSLLVGSFAYSVLLVLLFVAFALWSQIKSGELGFPERQRSETPEPQIRGMVDQTIPASWVVVGVGLWAKWGFPG